jgi:hypothetical protein
MVRMGDAIRERFLAAIAAALGVEVAMCNRVSEPSVAPIEAREVPAFPDAGASASASVGASDPAPIDAGAAQPPVALVDAAPPASSAAAAPPPPQPVPLSAFERFTPPPPKNAGPRPTPPEQCCGTSANCGPRVCTGAGNKLGHDPYLVGRGTAGLRAKPGLDDAARGRASSWIARASMDVASCMVMGRDDDEKGRTIVVDVHAASGADVAIAFSGASLAKGTLQCLGAIAPRLAGGLTSDGAPSKLVFTVVVQTNWETSRGLVGTPSDGGVR